MIYPYRDKSPQIHSSVFVAPGARVIGEVQIGQGSSVWFNTVIRGDVFPISIGEQSNLQDNSVIHVTSGRYATRIGNQVTVGHRVILHGCTVEDRVLVGMGAIVMDGAVVETESILGAGALVTPGTRIPPRVLALGSPCRVVRELRPEEIRSLRDSALHYCELADFYRKKE